MNLLEGAALFGGMAIAYQKAIHDSLDGACEIVEKEAKRVIGTYEYGWPSLQPDTIARKAKGDTPLLETGEMRDSIEHTVSGKSGFVGSNNDKAVWQELGTSRIPPRSFLGGACMRKGEEVAKHLGHSQFEAMTGVQPGHVGGLFIGGTLIPSE
jgi:hypothetical protein